MAQNEKYLQTHRLGEGVIYTDDPATARNGRHHHAAVIIKQHSETVVDLLVIFADGRQEIKTSVAYDMKADHPYTRAARPRM